MSIASESFTGSMSFPTGFPEFGVAPKASKSPRGEGCMSFPDESELLVLPKASKSPRGEGGMSFPDFVVRPKTVKPCHFESGGMSFPTRFPEFGIAPETSTFPLDDGSMSFPELIVWPKAMKPRPAGSMSLPDEFSEFGVLPKTLKPRPVEIPTSKGSPSTGSKAQKAAAVKGTKESNQSSEVAIVVQKAAKGKNPSASAEKTSKSDSKKKFEGVSIKPGKGVSERKSDDKSKDSPSVRSYIESTPSENDRASTKTDFLKTNGSVGIFAGVASSVIVSFLVAVVVMG
mmetsp:Transcript_28874/g.57652  ORF Transcript_28874/g.57652 Transcript_28874/m.57652 type:complete len:287 (-) Transcript_28874:70-930(-)